jgi:hypothetical protein
MPDRRPRRPASVDPRSLEQVPSDHDPTAGAEVAHMTAVAVVHRGREARDPEVVDRLVHLVESEGLDTVAALWSSSPPATLPGALWRMYALRERVRRDARTTADRYRSGVARAEVHDVVAGVADVPGAQEVEEVLDAVLSGVFDGDLAVALERAAAFCRVLAVGTALDADHVADSDTRLAGRITRGASSLVRTAEELEHAAGLWRAGTLE